MNIKVKQISSSILTDIWFEELSFESCAKVPVMLVCFSYFYLGLNYSVPHGKSSDSKSEELYVLFSFNVLFAFFSNEFDVELWFGLVACRALLMHVHLAFRSYK